MSLYLSILILSISVPLLLSFEKKLQFYKQWKYLFPSISIVALFYIVGDIYLTKNGVWGFNPRYLLNVYIFDLPIEEWLFFFIIPYASIFIHDSIILYFPKLNVPPKYLNISTIILIVAITLLLLFNLEKAYTVYILCILLFSLLLSLLNRSKIMSQFIITFLIILIPFIIVNAILSGSFIEEQVVWYNVDEILGISFLTIPVEDFGYAFSMIYFCILLREKFKTLTIKK